MYENVATQSEVVSVLRQDLCSDEEKTAYTLPAATLIPARYRIETIYHQELFN